MANNNISIKAMLDASDILQSLKQIKASLTSFGNKNGFNDFAKQISKELSTIETKMTQTFSKAPGVGASSKEIQKFANAMKNLAIDISNAQSKIEKFDLSNEYLQENIDSVKKLAQQYTDATKKVEQFQDAAKEVKIDQIVNKVPKGSKALVRGSQANEGLRGMRTAAQEGNVAQLTEIYKGKNGQGGLKKELENRRAALPEEGQRTQDQINQYSSFTSTLKMLESAYQSLHETAKQVQKSKKTQINIENKLNTELKEQKEILKQQKTAVVQGVSGVGVEEQNITKQIENFVEIQKKSEDTEKKVTNLSNKVAQFFSGTSIYYGLTRIFRNAIQDFQELDKQFNEIAIVSEYSTAEMWKSFDSVNKMAQEFGVTTKNVVEVQNLYYHQGKDMAAVNKLTAQTLTLAKITGLDYERATSELTAALNGYNLAASEAIRVTDSIAALDANAAISSEELMTALTKTASIASNAGMSLESTEVFLTKMIETTR